MIQTETLDELALFAGAGGGILGGKLSGWRTRCAVEINSYARRVLLARQQDGILPRFPIWDDIQTFDGRPWRGSIDIVSGGFPCQDISSCNAGAIGIDGARSGLWREMARVVGEVVPDFVFVENSPLLVGRGLAVVLGDLARLGYDARWGVLGARHLGAPIKRDRLWILGAKPNAERRQGFLSSNFKRCPKPQGWWPNDPLDSPGAAFEWLADRHGEPPLLGDPNGMAHIVDRLGAIGNGQVPAVAAAAWNLLKPTQ